MNWLNVVVGAAKEANESAHGARLKRDLESTIQNFSRLSQDIQPEVFAIFLKNRAGFLRQASNWSAEGKIKIGRQFQDEARRKFDFDQKEAYGLWLSGAWLESGTRNSPDAHEVYRTLESLARELIVNVSRPSEDHEPWHLSVQSTANPNQPLVNAAVRFLQRAIGAATGQATKPFLRDVFSSAEMRLVFQCIILGTMTSMAHGKGLSDAEFDCSFQRIFEFLKNNTFDLSDPKYAGVARETKRTALNSPYDHFTKIAWEAAQQGDPVDDTLAELLKSIR